MSERAAQTGQRPEVLALLRLGDGSWPDIARRLRRGEAPVEIAGSLGLAGGSLFSDDPWDDAVNAARLQLETWAEEGITVTTADDPRYPERLDDVRTLPPVLWTRGVADERDSAGVAVVGSRRASKEALAAAAEISQQLATAGVAVISGLAAGIDTAALQAALAGAGRVVGVIGTGIRRVYPSENADLQNAVAERGLLISQFWPDTAPTRYTFPIRNELMAGWSAVTLVMQADARSGARLQARVAIEQRRKVLLFRPVMWQEDWAQKYVGDGKAAWVSDVGEVLGELHGGVG